MRGVQLAPLCHLVPERAVVTGYCGTCRVHFSTLEGWAEHQHVFTGVRCACGRFYGVRADQAKHAAQLGYIGHEVAA
jgi:hypothetical protein